MRARTALAMTALLLALPATAAGGGGVVASASGGVHWTIPLPNAFGVEVVNQPLAFTARKYADGTVAGHFTYHQIVEGQSFNFGVDVTCLVVYDGNRAKIGGEIKTSNDPTLPPGGFAWFQVFDSGEGANALPDRSSLIGFGNEAANEAFCNSPTCRGSDRGTSTATRRSTPRRYFASRRGRDSRPLRYRRAVTVRDNPELQRYEAIVDGEPGVDPLRARRRAHPRPHGGRGGVRRSRGSAALIAATLDDIRARGLRMRPFCPFVKAYLERHPEYDDLIAA